MSTPSRQADDLPVVAGQAAPLSWQQEQIWLHSQWAGTAPVYQEIVTIHRQGGWREAPLRAALDAWAQRYSLPRTVFPVVAGEARQRVQPAAALPFEISGVTGRAEARQAAAGDGQGTMDLERGSLVRQRWGCWPGGQELYLTLHHLIFDGYTLQQLWLPEWAADYEALAAGLAPPPRATPLAYADYAIWQRGAANRDAAERAEEHRDFWRRQLAGDWPRLELGGDSRAGAYAAESRPFALEASLFGALAEMARTVRATPFMVLLAAFAVLLHRLGGQEAVVIGTPAAGRSQRRWERIAGPLVNTLPLRLVCDGNPPFGAVVRQARDAVLEALGHQDYPFALTMRAAPRAAGVAPNLEAYLSLQPPAETPPAGWSMSHLAVDNGTAKFPLHLDMAWTGAGAVEGRCRYQRARVDPGLGGELANCWTVLLAAAAKDWQQRIGALPLLSAARRRQMVALGQGPAPQLPPGTLAEIFARQAAAMAERVAIVALESSGGGVPPRRREIHYRDLRADVEQVAGGLRAAGIRPGDTVALALPRSAAAVTAMLAVIWCGAAYVPLRPEDPPRRRQSQLEQAGARWVIAESPDDDPPAAFAAAPAPVAAQTLTMAALRARGANSCPPPASGAEAAHAPAYVMFTSGSTGEPQAVRIPPAGIVRLAAQPGYADLGAEETFLQLAPLGFDAATFEIWAPLLNGGRLVIPPPGLPSVAELGEWIRREGVTTLWLTATLFNAVVDTDPAVLAPLRQLLTGGEALSPRHVRQAQQALPRVALFNGYGPTENTTFTCVYRIPAGTDGAIPLGRPIAHTAAYVVDGYGAPAPLGSEGELWAGGVGLAREYVGGDPAGRWVQPEWAAGERLFRTGDRARWTEASGGPVLEFLRRRDQQVKLRGMRLDLAGLEALLLRHPQVRQAAVMVADAGGGELTGYVATEASAEALSGWLARDLPAAMIPARWVLCAELPRLASGKLDRQALRLLPAGRRTASAPAGETERRLAAIWGELLGREAVGRDEDFYALGGHSLLGLRMLARMEREFGRRLSLAEMLAHRTVAAQAQWIDGARAEAAANEPRAVRMQAGDPAARPQFFSLEAVGRFLRLAEAMGPQQPWYGLRLAGLTELPHPCPLEAVAAYHLATLREAQPRGPYYLAGFCQNGVVAFELARQLAAAGERVACLALFDAASPAFLRKISGARWPWFRLRYAWQHRRQFAALDPGGAKSRRDEEEMVPSAPVMLWRRWRYRWLGPGNPPRAAERTVMVQYAVRHYRPAPFPGRIVLFRSQWRELAAAMGRGYDSGLGWEELAAGGLEVHEISNDHLTMFAPPGVGEMARVLEEIVATPPAQRSAAAEVGAAR